MVRWPGSAVSVTWNAGALAFDIAQSRFSARRQLIYWLLLGLFSPLIGGTNLVVTPDLPLLFFNALALLVFYRWRDNLARNWWLAFAVFWPSLGLGFFVKVCDGLIPAVLIPSGNALAPGAQSVFSPIPVDRARRRNRHFSRLDVEHSQRLRVDSLSGRSRVGQRRLEAFMDN